MLYYLYHFSLYTTTYSQYQLCLYSHLTQLTPNSSFNLAYFIFLVSHLVQLKSVSYILYQLTQQKAADKCLTNSERDFYILTNQISFETFCLYCKYFDVVFKSHKTTSLSAFCIFIYLPTNNLMLAKYYEDFSDLIFELDIFRR